MHKKTVVYKIVGGEAMSWKAARTRYIFWSFAEKKFRLTLANASHEVLINIVFRHDVQPKELKSLKRSKAQQLRKLK